VSTIGRQGLVDVGLLVTDRHGRTDSDVIEA
jgi:hypothetical protein